MNDLNILVDYRGAFYSSTKNVRLFCSMDVLKLSQKFAEKGWGVKIIGFPEVNFKADWKDKIVIYQSAEDPSLEYKSYIEDIVLGLTLAGARVVPSYPHLRAHHNKVFMEILRRTIGAPEANTISSKVFGTFEDVVKQPLKYPVVFKLAAGSGSRGVALLRDRNQAFLLMRKQTKSWIDFNSEVRERMKRLLLKGYIPYSLNRRKFILQEYIPNLCGDYKVLVYGKKVFVLYRKIRENDFRASGSGKFSYPQVLPKGLLDYVWQVFRGFDTPHASFDIAEDNNNFYLLEAQFVDFGPYTLENSPYHWERESNNWICKEETVDLESVFAQGITDYAKDKRWLDD